MKWKAAGASVRGSSHLRNGLPNQDAVSHLMSRRLERGSLVVAAVSDGHGSARHFRSQIGASHAVHVAINLIEEFLFRRDGNTTPTSQELQQLEQQIVDSWLASVRGDIEGNPFTPEELERLAISDGADAVGSIEENPAVAYGATLLVVGAMRSAVLYLQIGDGDILAVDAEGKTTHPLPEDERLFANQTTSLCLPSAVQDFRAGWESGASVPALVLLSTDGYVNSFRSEEDFLRIGHDYLKLLHEHGIEALSQELPGILAEATEQGSGDDISLAVLHRDTVSEPVDHPSHVPGKPLQPGKTAMIQDLTERHNAQQQAIGELSSRIEKTQRENRRLRFLSLAVLLCVAIAGTLFALHERGMLKSWRWVAVPSSRRARHVLRPDVGTPDVRLPSEPLRPPVVRSWILRIGNKETLPLSKGTRFTQSQIKGGGGKALYAEVAEEHGSLELINRSHDTWKIGKHNLPIHNGEHITLKSRIVIHFDDRISGELTKAEPAPPIPNSESQG